MIPPALLIIARHRTQMTARKLFLLGAIPGLGSLALDHALGVWIYNDIRLGTALALTAITHPVLTFLSTAGAALSAACVLYCSITRRDCSIARRDTVAGAPFYDTSPSPIELEAELLLSFQDAEPKAEDDRSATDFHPIFRVDFTGPWGVQRFRLTEADDVRDVASWATAQAEGRSFQIWVEHVSADGAALVHLATEPARSN